MLCDVAEAHRERFALDVLSRGLFQTRHASADVRLRCHYLFEADPYQALQNQAVVPRAVLERFEYAGRDANRIEIALVRIVGRRIPLGHDGDNRLVEVLDVLDERDRLFAAYVKGRDGGRKEHSVADRQNRKLVAELDFAGIRWRYRCNCFLFVAHAVLLLQLGQNPSFSSTQANIATLHFPGKGLTCGASRARQGHGVTSSIEVAWSAN